MHIVVTISDVSHPLKNPLRVIERHIPAELSQANIERVVERVYNAIPPPARMVLLRVCGLTSSADHGNYDYRAKIGQSGAPSLEDLSNHYAERFLPTEHYV